MTRIEYVDGIPPEVLPAIKDNLEPLSWLLPQWCQRLKVSWCSDEENVADGSIASMECSYEYRVLHLRILPAFLEQDTERRREILIHELIHGSVNVLFNYAYAEIERLIPEDENPKHHKSVMQELEYHCEATVQDLAFIIAQKF